ELNPGGPWLVPQFSPHTGSNHQLYDWNRPPTYGLRRSPFRMRRLPNVTAGAIPRNAKLPRVSPCHEFIPAATTLFVRQSMPAVILLPRLQREPSQEALVSPDWVIWIPHQLPAKKLREK